MFKNNLAHHETYSKGNNGEYDLECSYSVYEVFIELSRDREGNVLKNKDGSDRYHAIDDFDISTLAEDKQVKVIREGFFKDVYEVNGDVVEKVERDGKRIYYVVDESRLTTLVAGTKVVAKNGTYRTVSEVGYALVDDREIENPKTIAVRKFNSEDHKAEAEKIVKNRAKRAQQPRD